MDLMLCDVMMPELDGHAVLEPQRQDLLEKLGVESRGAATLKAIDALMVRS